EGGRRVRLDAEIRARRKGPPVARHPRCVWRASNIGGLEGTVPGGKGFAGCAGMMRQSRPAQSRPLASHAPMSSVTRASGSVVQPFVSIVVPCRNEAEYIGPLLDSMLPSAQPVARLEMLIVDCITEEY